MSNKDKLISIISNKKNEIDNKINTIISKYNKVSEIATDFNKVKDIKEEDINYYNNRTKETITFINRLITNNCLPTDEESINEIKKVILKLYKDEIEQDNDLKLLNNTKEELEEEIRLINEDIQDNYEYLMDLLHNNYESGIFTPDEIIEMNLLIGNIIYDMGINNEEIVNESEEPVEVEYINECNNDVVDIEEIFKKYGYDYNTLSKKTRELIEKYVDIEYLDHVLELFKKYKVSNDSLVSNQKTVFKILVDKEDSDILDKVLEYVDQNDCTLGFLLKYDAMFHKRNKRFSPKKSNSKTNEESKVDDNSSYFKTEGSHSDVIKNLDLVKKINKLERIDNTTLGKTKNVGLTVPHAKLMKNLQILYDYGIVPKGELPKYFSSLIGKYTSYQIDRFIECGLYDYIKNNQSYVNKTAHPFRFYKIRRALDLKIDIMSKSGMKTPYTADVPKSLGTTDNVNGIYYKSYEEDGEIKEEIVQEMYTDEQFQAANGVRYFLGNNSNKSGLYYGSYMFNEDSPKTVMDRVIDRKVKNEEEVTDQDKKKYYELATKLDELFSIYKESKIELTNEELEEAKNGKLITMLDRWICHTNNGNYRLKKDEYTYEFRAYKHPNDVIRISRIKVIKLFYILNKYKITYNYDNKQEKNFIWSYLKDNDIKELLVDVVLSAITYDSILSRWETYYLYVIVKSVLGGKTYKQEKRSPRI